ncbi:MAG: FHA domain-containing protein [Deltaproteobacteria bacterium]|nr:FHA domain-containing protein [Deltaproteobacteria bacterium]
MPASAPLQVYLRSAALSTLPEFLRALPGVGALVRLDERGGHDEPVRWAYDALIKTIPPDDGDDVFVDPSMSLDSDEATATGPSQAPLPIPAARDLATVMVLPRGGGRLGRAASSVVRIAERSVSRQHAMVAVDDDATVDATSAASFSVVDLDSDNGTAINGVLLTAGSPQRLRSGDVLQLGDVVFLFLDGAAFFSHLPALAA